MYIEHIAMYVRDLEQTKNFYEEYFQAAAGPIYHNERSGFRSYFLTFADRTRLEIMTKPGVTAGRGGGPGSIDGHEENGAAGGGETEYLGYTHLAFAVGSRENVDNLTERLRAGGYPVLSGPRMTGDGYYESCIGGPEGQRIEITA